MKKTDIEALVSDAIALDREITEKSALLERMKDKLRVEAGRKSDGEKVVFEAPGSGAAEVVFVKDRTSLKKGADPHVLLDVLLPSTWDSLFTIKTTVVLPSDFEEALALLPKLQQKLVEHIIERKESASRVAFRAVK